MAGNPLFSTYRQDENRVTSSMLAVFQRIDTGLLERLLGPASGELPWLSWLRHHRGSW